MVRRSGWVVLAAVAGLFFLATVAGTAATLFVAVRDGEPVKVLRTAGLGVVFLLFWAWIFLGAWHRFRPPVDETTGLPAPIEPVGPWGWVGRALLAVLVIGFVVISVWSTRAGRQQDATTARVRRDADRIARSSNLTIAKVRDAKTAYKAWTFALDEPGDAGPNPLDQLLPVPGADVQDAVLERGHAALLIRPDQGPPCVVVDIDNDDLITTRSTTRC